MDRNKVMKKIIWCGFLEHQRPEIDDLSDPSQTHVPKFEKLFAVNIWVAKLHKNPNSTSFLNSFVQSGDYILICRHTPIMRII